MPSSKSHTSFKDVLSNKAVSQLDSLAKFHNWVTIVRKLKMQKQFDGCERAFAPLLLSYQVRDILATYSTFKRTKWRRGGEYDLQ